MKQLLSNYSVGQILLFLVVAAFAIKEFLSFIDWAHERMDKTVDKSRKTIKIEQRLDDAIEERKEAINELREKETEIEESIQKLDIKINMLIDSDRDDIKAWLTSQHHHFMEKGEIDYYSLDCITKRYEHYKLEGGNTFIDDLMEDINNLPKSGEKLKVHKI